VATGSHLEESIMGVMNLRELGIPFIMAKAKNKKYMQILQKIGADYVVRPEKEMGERVAKKLVSRNIIDLIDIDDDYSIVEIAAPAKWVGKTLKALELRTNYGINVLGIRKNPKEHLSISPDAFYTIEANDQLLVIADNKIFKKFESLFRI
jgi:trk system potassium uptake protein